MMWYIVVFLFLSFSTMMNAQTFDYESAWQKIEKQQEEGAHKSLRSDIDKIYDQALKEENGQQRIKALLHLARIIWETEDDVVREDSDTQLKVVNRFRQEIAQSKGVDRLILQHYLAQVYYQYGQTNRRSLRNVTATTTESESDDFRTWSMAQLNKQILALYEELRAGKAISQQASTNEYQTLLTCPDEEGIMPTLYDLFTESHIDYLTSGLGVNQLPFATTNEETIAMLRKERMDFHRADSDKTAYLYCAAAELSARYADDQATLSRELEALGDAHQTAPYSADLYYLAAMATEQVMVPMPLMNWGGSQGKADLLRVHALCTKATTLVPESKWSRYAKNRLVSLSQPDLSFTMELWQLPNQPIALALSHRNMATCSLRVTQIPQVDILALDSLVKAEYNLHYFFYNKEAVKQGKEMMQTTVELKAFDDFQSHSTLYKMAPLPKGLYQMQIEGRETKYGMFSVSSIVPVVQIGAEGKLMVQFVYADSGKAVANKRVVMLRLDGMADNGFMTAITIQPKGSKQAGAAKPKESDKQFREEGVTDSRGCYPLEVESDYRSVNCLFYFPGEEESCLVNFTPHGLLARPNEEQVKVQQRAHIFTDRAIYRPGQTVHFKLLLTEHDQLGSKIVPNTQTGVKLSDMHGKEVGYQVLTSNAFGSVAGTFQLPLGKVGSYSLSTVGLIGGHYAFSVEEYKRPKFEVVLNPLTETYTLSQEVAVTGVAQAFSGSNISEAKVTYRVERSRLWLWRNWSSARYWPNRYESPVQVAQGESVTDSEGKFTVQFEALPAEEKRKEEYRSYQYNIIVEVTDLNGETHTAQQELVVGDLPKQLGVVAKSDQYTDEFKSLLVTSKNLSGEDSPSKGTLTVTRLLPTHKLRVLSPNRPFTPDYQLYDYDTFVRAFPRIPYSPEEGSYTKKGEVMLTLPFDTEKDKSVAWTRSLPAGKYLVEAYTLYGTDTIATSHEVTLADRKTMRATKDLFFEAKLDKREYAVGDKATLHLMSDLKEGTLQMRTERNRVMSPIEHISLKGGDKRISFVITEQDLVDGITLHLTFISKGDYALKQVEIPIKQRVERELEIVTETFRDRLLPGAPETWKFTVRGKQKEAWMAEVVAAMYDASLDQFREHYFGYNEPSISGASRQLAGGWYSYARQFDRFSQTFTVSADLLRKHASYIGNPSRPEWQWFDFRVYPLVGRIAGLEPRFSVSRSAQPGLVMSKNAIVEEEVMMDMAPEMSLGATADKPASGADVAVRKNLQETAFFFPQIKTDEAGNFTLTFTSPEALTKWKLLLFAHTKELKYGKKVLTMQTQKELMVTPNAPRFLREGDEVTLSTKIANLAAEALQGEAQLLLFDALTDEAVDAAFAHQAISKPFAVAAGGNSEVSWTLKVPTTVQAVRYRVVAKAGNFQDGEESVLPILTNRMLVTETLPVSVREGETNHYQLDKLRNNTSTTLQHYGLTLEMTTNPTWLALFSLPYLREYPYDCSEQVFSRMYGNLLSQKILNDSPEIKRVFEEWRAKGALKSPLQTNEELKSILLEETPWLNNAGSKEEQMKRLALLFDLNQMAYELEQSQQKLLGKQNGDGGFPWFEGGYSSLYISQHILGGFGKLSRMLEGESSTLITAEVEEMITKLIGYVDRQMERILAEAKAESRTPDASRFIHYYYARSFWLEAQPLPEEVNKFLKEVKGIDYKKYDLMQKALLAVVWNRYGLESKARQLVRNLKESAVDSKEMGMYWKTNTPGWFWYQAPVESQTALIEAFAEVTPNDLASVEAMKVWLLKQRQTNAWATTKSTTEAVYALLYFGKNWATVEDGVVATVAGKTLYPTTETKGVEQYTGYFKKEWEGGAVTPEMAAVTVKKSTPGVAYGALYWQYFEDMDRITEASSDIKIEKQLYVKRATDEGLLLTPLTEAVVGDLITVRLVIRTDRDMEYIHIKDTRASGLEPTNVISGYKWQNGVGYYESTRDAATNFFMDYLPKGVYTFEYDLRANNAGQFSNGITTVQNMYAPEMSAHSKGVRVKINRR